MSKIKYDELSPEVKKLLGVDTAVRQKKSQTSIEVIRRNSIQALSSISSLSTSDRERALKLSIKMNRA